jgi:hypothetical protein
MNLSITYHKTSSHLIVKVLNTSVLRSNPSRSPLEEQEHLDSFLQVELHYKEHKDNRHFHRKKVFGKLRPETEVVFPLELKELNESHLILAVSNNSTSVEYIPQRYLPPCPPNQKS